MPEPGPGSSGSASVILPRPASSVRSRSMPPATEASANSDSARMTLSTSQTPPISASATSRACSARALRKVSPAASRSTPLSRCVRKKSRWAATIRAWLSSGASRNSGNSRSGREARRERKGEWSNRAMTRSPTGLSAKGASSASAMVASSASRAFCRSSSRRARAALASRSGMLVVICCASGACFALSLPSPVISARSSRVALLTALSRFRSPPQAGLHTALPSGGLQGCGAENGVGPSPSAAAADCAAGKASSRRARRCRLGKAPSENQSVPPGP